MTPNSTDSATRDGLHIEIMQLPCDTEECPVGGVNAMLAYKSGHRDARHAAADLALEFDALLAASRAEAERLREANSALLDQMHHFAHTDQKLWDEGLRDAASFESWVRSRAMHMLNKFNTVAKD